MLVRPTTAFIIFNNPGAIPRLIEAHRHILDALERRDRDKGRLWVDRHLRDWKAGFERAGMDRQPRRPHRARRRSARAARRTTSGSPRPPASDFAAADSAWPSPPCADPRFFAEAPPSPAQRSTQPAAALRATCPPGQPIERLGHPRRHRAGCADAAVRGSRPRRIPLPLLAPRAGRRRASAASRPKSHDTTCNCGCQVASSAPAAHVRPSQCRRRRVARRLSPSCRRGLVPRPAAMPAS